MPAASPPRPAAVSWRPGGRASACHRCRHTAHAASVGTDPIFPAIAKWRASRMIYRAARIEGHLFAARSASERCFEVGSAVHTKDGKVFREETRFAASVEELDHHMKAAKAEPVIIRMEGSELCTRITTKPDPDIAEIRAALVEAEAKLETGSGLRPPRLMPTPNMMPRLKTSRSSTPRRRRPAKACWR